MFFEYTSRLSKYIFIFDNTEQEVSSDMRLIFFNSILELGWLKYWELGSFSVLKTDSFPQNINSLLIKNRMEVLINTGYLRIVMLDKKKN